MTFPSSRLHCVYRLLQRTSSNLSPFSCCGYVKDSHWKVLSVSNPFHKDFSSLSIENGKQWHYIQPIRLYFCSSFSWKRHEYNSLTSFQNLLVINGKDSNFVPNSKAWVHNESREKISQQISAVASSLSSQNENLKEQLKEKKASGAEAVQKVQQKFASSKENIKTIPNLLTTLRMCSAPLIAGLVVNECFVSAFSIFVVAGLTDLLDGYIARNFKNQTSALGTALDPLADKLLMCFLTISLTSVNLIPIPLTVLILGRDAGLILGTFYIRYISLAPPRTLSRYFDISHVTAKLYPSTISKVNTVVQLSFVALSLGASVFDFVGHPYLQTLMYTTAATTFLSGADYVLTWRKRLKIVKNN